METRHTSGPARYFSQSSSCLRARALRVPSTCRTSLSLCAAQRCKQFGLHGPQALEDIGPALAAVTGVVPACAGMIRSRDIGPLLIVTVRERTSVMVPSHPLPVDVDAHIRERPGARRRHSRSGVSPRALGLARVFPYREGDSADLSPGDMVAFHRPYKNPGAAKGDERRVGGVQHKDGTGVLEGPGGETVSWDPVR